MRQTILHTLRMGALLVVPMLSALAAVDGESDADPSPPAVEIEPALHEAQGLMDSLEYEQAIAVLEPVLAADTLDTNRLRETYLLLIEAHVYRGSHSAAGTKEQQLWYDEARDLIRDCLSVPELRHTVPDPPERYPEEMLEFFDDIRREILGSFQIEALDPADAEVVFDGAALTPREDGTWLETDVHVGTHPLLIRHPSYQDITEEIEISPATVVTRSYSLNKNKGVGWYATRVAVPLALAAGLVVAVVNSGGDTAPPPDPPLPADPPAPPD